MIRLQSASGEEPLLTGGATATETSREQLETAQKADRQWREQRREELKAEIAALDSNHLGCMAWVGMIIAGNLLENLLRSILEACTFDISAPHIKAVLDVASIFLVVGANLWLRAVRQKARRRELSLLTQGAIDGG